MVRAWAGVVCGFALLAVMGGCSPYVGDYEYTPRPATVEIRPAATQPTTTPPGGPVSVQASVIGVRRADGSEGIPLSVEVRMRVQNTGSDTVDFDPRSLRLTDGAFMVFPPPVLGQAEPLTLGPTQTAVLSAFFPFPPGHSYDNVDMQALELRWDMQLNGQNIGPVVYFRRITRVYYEEAYPYPYPYGWYGGGAVFIHAR